MWSGSLISLLLLSWSVPVFPGAFERLFAPKPELWSFWQVHDEASTGTISHQAWDDFLRSYLVKGEGGVNRLAYARVDETSVEALSQYIKSLSQQPVRQYTREQQHVYWINLYNAATVRTVLEHYPVKSIRDIKTSPGWLSQGPWGDKILNIEGQAISLNDIEHRILRPIWKDPRLHYVLNCAAIGCPNLVDHAYAVDTIEADLEAAARAYVNHRRGVHFDADKLIVSSIYSWYRVDFGGDNAGVIEHLKHYAQGGLRQQIEGSHRVTDDQYDWHLNDAG